MRTAIVTAWMGWVAAVLQVSALARNVPSTSAVPSNSGDTSVELRLVLPAAAQEGTGLQPTLGRVLQVFPSLHDVDVTLSSDPPVQVPESVVIPAGRSTATFPIRMENDDLVNPTNRVAFVRAAFGSQPPVKASLRVIDNDDPGITVRLPSYLVEGEAVTGSVQLGIPRDHPVTLTWKSDHPQLLLPPAAFLPPGTIEATFALVLSNTSTLDGVGYASLCAQLGDFQAPCVTLQILDDEADVRDVEFAVPNAVFSDEPHPMEIRLKDLYGATSRTNLTGVAMLGLNPQVARFQPQPFPIAFSNGIFQGNLTFSGEAMRAELELQVAGKSHYPGKTDILRGHTVQGPFTDLVALPGRPRLLALHAESTHTNSQLIEIDAETGTTRRSLPLDHAAHRLAISDDGTVAWIACIQSSLQRIDLVQWRTNALIFLTNSARPARPEGLLVLAGETDRLLVLINDSENLAPDVPPDLQAVAVIDGVRRGSSVVIPNTGRPGHLVAGRTSAEAIVDWGGAVQTLAVGNDGVLAQAQMPVGFPHGFNPNLIRVGDLLYRGNGEILRLDSLTRIETHSPGHWVALAEGTRRLGYLDETGQFRLMNRTSLALTGQHAIPWRRFAEAQTMVPWADDGFAVLTKPAADVVIWRSPLTAQPAADLAVLGQAPESHRMVYSNGIPVHNEVLLNWIVTNRGPGVAHAVELLLPPAVVHRFSSMAPGESRTVTSAVGVAAPFTLRRTAQVSSQSADPVPENNSAHLRTDVFEPTLGDVRQSLLDARDMTVSADGQRLWIAVAPPAHEGGGALLEMNPDSGVIQRRVPLDATPEQVVATPDGRFLYVRLAPSQLLRWNLEAQAADFTVGFTNETVLDLVPLPSNTRGVVVATSRRVVVLDDTTERPEVIATAAEPRHLGFAGDDLWVAQPGQLQRCRIIPTGVVADGESTPLFVPSGNYAFATDSRRLYFEGRHYNLITGEILGSPLGTPFLPDPQRGLVYAASGGRLLRYDAATLELLAEERFPGMAALTVAMMPWGSHGLAMLNSSGMVWTCESSVVPDPVGGDIAVTIAGPPRLTHSEPLEWIITITNSSAESAARSRLILQRTGDFRDPSFDGPIDLEDLGATYLDLGDLPPLSSTSLRYRARVASQDYSLRATVTTAAAADRSDNNSDENTGTFGLALADLSARLLAPPIHDLVHQTVALRVLITNSGPSAASAVALELTTSSGLRLVSVSPGAVDNPIYATLDPLEAGTSREVEVHVVRPFPGLTSMALQIRSEPIDPQLDNNRISALVDVRHDGSATHYRRFEFPRGHTVWSERRQELIAAFDAHPALAILGPDALDLRSEIPFPTSPRQVALSHDGKTAWVALVYGDVVQVDLESRSVVSQFRTEIHTLMPWGAFAAVEGESDILVAAGSSSRGHQRVIAYRNGLPLPSTLEGLQGSDNGFFLVPSTEGHLFVSSGRELREVKVDANGITEVRNIDWAANPGGALSFYPGWLAFSKGRVVDLTTLKPKDDLATDATLLVDTSIPTLYRCRPVRALSPGDPLTVESFSPGTLEPLWRVELPGEQTLLGEFTQVVTLGRHGLLLVGTHALRLHPDIAGPTQADLTIGPQRYDLPWFPGVAQSVSLQLNQTGAWTARNAVLEIEVSGNLEWIEPAIALENGRGVLSLGHLHGTTRLTPVLRPSAPGDGTLRLRLRSDLPDPNPANNALEWRVQVPPPPVLVLDDAPIIEGTGPSDLRSVNALLSSPAPADWDHPFRVNLLSAQASDFAALQGVFRFRRGTTTSSVRLIQGDTLPERPETFLLELLPGPVALARTSVVLSLEDDDLPRLTPRGTSLQEGNQGITQAAVPVVLLDPADYPVEVHYQTRPGNATAGVDFQDVSGWLRFEPGQRTNHVFVPILGDVQFEATESLEVFLTQTPNILLTRPSAVVTLLNDDPAPALTLALRQHESGAWQVHFDTADGARYQLQVDDSLGDGGWENFGAPILGTGQPASFPIPASLAPSQFFRIQVKSGTGDQGDAQSRRMPQ